MNIVMFVYCFLAKSTQNRVAAFYRKCLRLIYNLLLRPIVDLHQHFRLPSVQRKYQKSLIRRMNNIQQYDLSLDDCIVQQKNLRSTVFTHYRELSNIRHMPRGCATRRLAKLIDNDMPTFSDRLVDFALGVSRTSEWRQTIGERETFRQGK